MKRFSLTRRLIFAVILSQLLLAIGLVVLGCYYSRFYLRSAFDINLEGRALSVAALVYYRDDGVPGLLFDGSKIPPSPHHVHKDIYFVRTDHGGFERHAQNYQAGFFERIPAGIRFWDFQLEGEPYRAIILRDVPILDTEESFPRPFPKLTVMYAAPTMDISQRIGALAASIAITSLVLLIPTLILAVWSIRRTLAPLKELARQAGSISVRTWKFEPSAEAKATAELEPLINAIETVLDGLHRAFTRQREFLGDAAHELKTSVAILKSTWQSLLNRPRTAAEYRQGLGQVSRDSERLEDLLDRMLRLARVEQWAADGIHRDLDTVDLASTCEMAVARMTQLAAERGIEISFSATDCPTMLADPADLELVWINLLENAIQYSPAGSVVNIQVRAEGQAASVRVSDSGRGIPEAELPHIFERFRRGDPSRARATGGFGLGLAMTKSIVEAYDGTIQVQSKLGEGTQFLVLLPLAKSLPEQQVSMSHELQPYTR
jgi:signal transduction histidine kinase